jgi:protocatechuate 3,4-dioxygenase alpha subunit
MTLPEPTGPRIATASLTVGPFFHVGPASTSEFGRMAIDDTPGDHISLVVRVIDGDGAPVSDAMVELWQADATGQYAPRAAAPGADVSAGFTGFGRLGTTADGSCRFETVRPGRDAAGGQAPHINACLFARGLLRHLYTRIYFEGDPHLASDPLLSAVPSNRRATLLARLATGHTWEFVIRLQGDDETVFFDI